MKPGGTPGGNTSFLAGAGLILMALGLYFLFDSVYMSSGGGGLISGTMGRGLGAGSTTSMGVIFVPFLLGIAILFVNAEKPWAWWLTLLGLLLIIIEMLSRIRFEMMMKTSHFLLITGMIAAGAGLIAKAFVEDSRENGDPKK